MKNKRFVHVFLSVAAVIWLSVAGVGSATQARQNTGVSADARFVSTPVLYRTSHFFVLSAGGSPSLPAVGKLLESIYSRVSQAMASYGLALELRAEPLVWMCFDDRERYRRHALEVEQASPAFQYAYYSTRSNHVVLFCDDLPKVRPAAGRAATIDASVYLTALEGQPPRGRHASEPDASERIVVLTHELAHQMAYNSGLQKRGVMYPLWVSEGLATFFEDCALSPSERLLHASRRRRLAQLRAERRLLPLHELAVLVGPDTFEMSMADVYAQCWGLLAFLLQRHSDELSAYLTESAQSPLGRRSSTSLHQDFVKHFGDMGALDRDWREFVGSLSHPDLDASPTRAGAAHAGL
ncbi:MAG: DUF1570 domain-containing protein [Sedimentisphaerales bacterium]|nr:DUF1570 domain-containing protein [Sedimentisphaerales bacterium]